MVESKATLETVDWLGKVVADFLETSPTNSLEDGTGEKAWTDYMMGFSNGADPIFESYKEHVGEFHWTPAEAFALAWPDEEFTAEELTVISYILPQTEATKKDNRASKVWPAERWARSRIFGEKTNEALRAHLADSVTEAGFKAVAPSLLPDWAVQPSEKFYLASKWSERHAAHASGLGTFALCDGLITPKGKAMRTASVVAKISIEPSPRPYEDHLSYCLFYAEDGACKECAVRCPVNAISDAGHDKKTCQKFLGEKTAKYVEENFHFKGYGCGLCQTGVPCESRIPSLDQLK